VCLPAGASAPATHSKPYNIAVIIKATDFGLSYTTFAYSDLRVNPTTVTPDPANSEHRASLNDKT
jgi:hypothetical protein